MLGVRCPSRSPGNHQTFTPTLSCSNWCMAMAEQPLSAWQVTEAAGAWRTAGGDLPDLNVWLALSHTDHPFYAQATAYWEQACAEQTRLWFCRTTMLGLVRLLAQPRVMDRAVLGLPQALAAYQSWLAV